ncbi:MAG: hypothetical protein B6U95_07705 [Thermofilum sp. ex4484_82]|nr:MAG: hypothetical protein B6U95_07705 [Thermofilum sp. ex4484_82]OYT36957.1 MAG: hypothetical protein B6U96_07705 [Archaeoglobales archaeon ex4484_92]
MVEHKIFTKMTGFHRLESLWRIEYRAKTLEPLLTQPATEEAKEEISEILGKVLAKTELDAVPLVIGNRAVITGNAVKGVFRHLISAQLTAAGVPVCVQKVKLGEGDRVPEGRLNQCPPNNPCFVCTWFGTASRQGALYFSLLTSVKNIDEILAEEPIPMIAVKDEHRTVAKRAFLLLAPVKSGVEFTGWITGENLSEEIIGAIKEVQDMSEKGFIQFGGFKTRGMGSVKLEITRIEKYKTIPFTLEEIYEGEKLKNFLEKCQKEYHKLLERGKNG